MYCIVIKKHLYLQNKNTTDMKMTVNINLAGMPFVIDDDAYRVLKNYIDDIASRLKNNAEESLSDIECRIAEIFRDKGVDGFRVVTLSNVREAMSIIGSPDIFGEGRVFMKPESETKRLLRDPDNRILGGVCSGVALYFGLDTVLIRLALVLLLFLGGVSFLMYIIAWIVIPKASTPQDFAVLEEMRKRKK